MQHGPDPPLADFSKGGQKEKLLFSPEGVHKRCSKSTGKI